MFDTAQTELAERILAAARERNFRIGTAESCTGGLIAGCLTAIAGSSDVIERGFVTYTNEAKNELLGVPEGLFETVGAVSEEVARAMAQGVLATAPVDVAVSVTGIAGPGGGTETKPVGLVHLAVARRDGEVWHRRHVFAGDRNGVRSRSVSQALEMLFAACTNG